MGVRLQEGYPVLPRRRGRLPRRPLGPSLHQVLAREPLPLRVPTGCLSCLHERVGLDQVGVDLGEPSGDEIDPRRCGSAGGRVSGPGGLGGRGDAVVDLRKEHAKLVGLCLAPSGDVGQHC
jgi:hypothetical protein